MNIEFWCGCPGGAWILKVQIPLENRTLAAPKELHKQNKQYKAAAIHIEIDLSLVSEKNDSFSSSRIKEEGLFCFFRAAKP